MSDEVQKLKPEVKEAWIKALTSGEYKQIQNRLKGQGGFCCLGVLTDLAVKAGVGRWSADENFVRDNDGGLAEIEKLALPECVKGWAGLRRYSPPLVQPEDLEGKRSLADLNDREQRDYTFEKIAELIREQL